jgi:Multicopper oxidase
LNWQTTSESYSFAAVAVYNVEHGKRYRFRFINAGFNVCPLLLQIENHEMEIIASEISYVHPFVIDSLFTLNGERFDFVVDANKEPKDYWVRVKTMLPCRTVIEAFAILRYGPDHKIHKSSGTKVVFPSKPPPHASNDFPQNRLFNSPMPKVQDISVLSLKSYKSDKSIIESPPDQQFHLFLDTPNLLDYQMLKYGNYYALDCKFFWYLLYRLQQLIDYFY